MQQCLKKLKVEIAVHKKKKPLSSTAFNNRNDSKIFLYSALKCIKNINFVPDIVVFSYLQECTLRSVCFSSIIWIT